MVMDNKIDIEDNYEHAQHGVEYVMENVLGLGQEVNSEWESLKDLYNSCILNSCQCQGSCGQAQHHCSHGGNYFYDETSNELVLAKRTHNDIFYECSPMCACEPEKCTNRLVQFGPRKHLRIISSEHYQSRGLMTIEAIPQGAFVCEYAGELLTKTEARKRIETNRRTQQMNYILCMNLIAHNFQQQNIEPSITTMIVDPSGRGNIGRYLNHSCEPNCEIFAVYVDSPLPKIAIFTNRIIKPGEELCFHYNGGVPSNLSSSGIPCLCKTHHCEKYLPSNDFF